ncbi:unnamed protein product, partial [Rotaria sp. Silwood2]
QSACENEGQCFQEDQNCPRKSICICSPYFYGIQCQFRVNGFGLSLDAILHYHIQPQVNFLNQFNVVLFSLIVTTIGMIAGFVNGILSLITFTNKLVCQVSCGWYLLGSSNTTLLTTIMFGLKF